jgi:hypothetical protein
MVKPFLISWTLTLALSLGTVLPLCGRMFRCGCTLADGARRCNIQRAGEPHCPWCSHSLGAFATDYGLAFAVTSGVIYASLRLVRAHVVVGLCAGLVSYWPLVSLAGLMTARYLHYPAWYGWRLR